MTIGNDPGSVNVSSRAFGTLGGPRVGSFTQSKVTSGTFALSSSGAGYGSYGTIRGQAVRHQAGSFIGTVSAHRVSFSAHPGTWRVRASGTLGYFAAPAYVRYLSVYVDVSAGGDAWIRQSSVGTVARVGRTAGKHTLIGPILPNRGSYKVGTASVASPGVLFWKEWDP